MALPVILVPSGDLSQRPTSSALLPKNLQHSHSRSCSVCRSSGDGINAVALRRKQDPLCRGGFSLGVDLGTSRTGLSLSKGFSVHSRSRSCSVRGSNVDGIKAVTLEEIPPNALRREQDPLWRGGFSLGVDLGTSRTGLALSKGFSVRPLTVLELRGHKLEKRLLQIAQQEEADEFIIGLPRSCDGKETPQSNKVRSVAGRFAVQAAERGWRVYLQDEHGTSTEAIDYMIDMGLNKSARRERLDAYAATMVLGRYFSTSGRATELVVPKQLTLQEKIRSGPPEDVDFFPEMGK